MNISVKKFYGTSSSLEITLPLCCSALSCTSTPEFSAATPWKITWSFHSPMWWRCFEKFPGVAPLGSSGWRPWPKMRRLSASTNKSRIESALQGALSTCTSFTFQNARTMSGVDLTFITWCRSATASWAVQCGTLHSLLEGTWYRRCWHGLLWWMECKTWRRRYFRKADQPSHFTIPQITVKARGVVVSSLWSHTPATLAL